MTFRHRAFAGALALLMIGAVAAERADASVNRQFRDAVARVLTSVRSGNDFLSGLSSREFRAFVACAQGAMDSASPPQKRYVLAARNLGDQRRRFDEVALENRAALKQRVARECS